MDSKKLTDDERNILGFLRDNNGDVFNIRDISKNLNISYPTALKRIYILERFGYIKIITVGNNKICILETGNDKEGF